MSSFIYYNNIDWSRKTSWNTPANATRDLFVLWTHKPTPQVVQHDAEFRTDSKISTDWDTMRSPCVCTETLCSGLYWNKALKWRPEYALISNCYWKVIRFIRRDLHKVVIVWTRLVHLTLWGKWKTAFFTFPWTVCQPPYQPENGGYICHPSSCGRLTHGTVIEYFCDEGYILKGDYKYLTCQFGQWDSQVKLSCLLEQGRQNQVVHLCLLDG